VTSWLALAVSVLSTVGAQLLFKSYHVGGRRTRLLGAIMLFVLAVPATMLAVRGLGVGRVYVAAALSYVIAPLFAVRLFDERMSRMQLFGLALIVTGVIAYNVR